MLNPTFRALAVILLPMLTACSAEEYRAYQQMMTLEVVDAQHGTRDKPYFAVIEFSSRFGVPGSTEVRFVNPDGPLWIDPTDEGETSKVPIEGRFEVRDVQAVLADANDAPVPILGQIIVAMESDEIGWFYLGPRVAATAVCLDLALVHFIEGGQWAMGAGLLALSDLQEEVDVLCENLLAQDEDGEVQAATAGLWFLPNPDDTMGQASVLQLGISQGAFNALANLNSNLSCTPIVTNDIAEGDSRAVSICPFGKRTLEVPFIRRGDSARWELTMEQWATVEYNDERVYARTGDGNALTAAESFSGGNAYLISPTLTQGTVWAGGIDCNITAAAGELVSTKCFRHDGTTDFLPMSRLITSRTRDAYVFADAPTATQYEPAIANNPQGTSPLVRRLGPGDYWVDFPGLWGVVRTAQVSAVHSGTNRCKIRYWNGDRVAVRCHDIDGDLDDTAFYLVADNRHLVQDTYAMYRVANGSDPTPDDEFSSEIENDRLPRFVRTWTGEYDLDPLDPSTIRYLLDPPVSFVSAYGADDTYCRWSRLGYSFGILCTDADGNPADSTFVLSFPEEETLL